MMRLRHLAREALAKLLDRHMTGGAHDQAGDAARRLLSLDPLLVSRSLPDRLRNSRRKCDVSLDNVV
jgi:hypothetical protein